ncbi:MAG: TetR/AcrR family transcriptional regulator [Cyanobacteria bacterium SZAS LIN-5]|nr:TetR/AcrR family transcriptional regulator [Cyanobacteria bacterium SZAS LIN-5]RTL46094.1 MAG: TetR/AcrR family transcriptional regulator [Candidatus Melainabacteria bacterium]
MSRAINRTNKPHGLSVAHDETDRAKHKREKIMQGALRTFLSYGYSASMDAIAAEAGVAKQTLYSYFNNKEDLFAALMDRLLEHFVDAGMKPELRSLPTQAFLRKLAQITLSQMDDWEYVSMLRLVIGESGRFPQLSEVYLTRLVNPGIQKLTHYIKENDELAFGDPEAVARIMHGALINFIISQEVLGGKHTMPMSRERVINSLIDMVLFAAQQSAQSR